VSAIAHEGLKARAIRTDKGDDERIHLAYVAETVESGRSPAEAMLEVYERDWRRDIDRVFKSDYVF
jgi:glutamate--cysteine ligase